MIVGWFELPPQVSKMVFDPLHVLAEGGRAGHGFYRGADVICSGLVAGVVFGFEAADDLADLIGDAGCGIGMRGGGSSRSGGSRSGSRRAASRGLSGGGRVGPIEDPFLAAHDPVDTQTDGGQHDGEDGQLSWKPLVKSNASATITTNAKVKSLFTGRSKSKATLAGTDRGQMFFPRADLVHLTSTSCSPGRHSRVNHHQPHYPQAGRWVAPLRQRGRWFTASPSGGT